ncbi:hypothetical protein C6496_23195 [Candidatus Poribacteria bacterium]|nr:MAG: hypothetical protein C6496_23195 [Candidatus Poribacteria bacterium]
MPRLRIWGIPKSVKKRKTIVDLRSNETFQIGAVGNSAYQTGAVGNSTYRVGLNSVRSETALLC